ncbi:MAG: hypothetical protein Q8867_06740 [Bacteroidota bacterium]|nr:hypothetical protein [Bacteroidota bacterium]
MKKAIILIGFLSVVAVIITSCKKDPGEGGTSSISGKVYAKDYNSTFTVLQGEYYVPDKWVFIVYGDRKDYGNKIRTNYDGTYEFKYLRPGTYHIYAYSKDSTLQTNAEIAVIKDVTIKKQYQEVIASDIVIFTVNGKN